ncbi:MAG: lytic transglycosylase domain-containing protein [Rhodoplanes sp.]
MLSCTFERVTNLGARALVGRRELGGLITRATGRIGLRHIRVLALLTAGVLLTGIPSDAISLSRHANVSTKKAHRSATASSHRKQARTSRTKRRNAARRAASRRAASKDAEPAKPALPGDLGVVQQAIVQARKGKVSDATALVKSVSDPVAQKLVEWVALRDGDSTANFDRYEAFIRANPHWPGIPSLRRRAEAKLWQERRDGATVRGFIGEHPESIVGRLALARVLLGEGDRAAAEREVRAVWRSADLSAGFEDAVLKSFDNILTRSDHLARMDRRIGEKDFSGAMRAARRAGGDAVAIVKACSGSFRNAGNARKLLDEVSSDARNDPGYMLCRIHSLLRSDSIEAATKLMLAVPSDDPQAQETDEWWRKRRTLARELLDRGDPESAYQVAKNAATPENPYYRAEFHFMAGWIALRFLDDPATALVHFTHVDDDTTNPVILSRAAYWRGRTYETEGRTMEMRRSYEVAALHSTAYYGQLARARLGMSEMELRSPPAPVPQASSEVVRAAELLYAIGERQLALSFLTTAADEGDYAAEIAALAEVAKRNDDARAVLLVGKTALARGLPLDVYAFPDIGIPNFKQIGPDIDLSIVYSVARTESQFNQRDSSPAQAVGLMQVTPEAGRDTAKRFNVRYDWKRMVNDPVYNTQMGAAEVAALLQEYRGSYIMSFAGYNAGRGRVQTWVARYGDPRAAEVDAIDWVERIPFSETRNYVQRVMENLQVYRVRLGESTAAALGPDLGVTAAAESPKAPRAREALAR